MINKEKETNKKEAEGNTCDHCGNELDVLPFTCKNCGGYFCEKHRSPESHDCSKISPETTKPPSISTSTPSKKRKIPWPWIILITLFLITIGYYYGSPYFDEFISNLEEKTNFSTTTIFTTTTSTTTTSTTTTTTIPPFTGCKLFDMKVYDLEEFDQLGEDKILVLHLTANYTGIREDYYDTPWDYDFELKVDKGYYYKPRSSGERTHCKYAEVFKIESVMPEDTKKGCLEFEILDDTEPVELIFHDKKNDDTCHIRF